MPIAQLPFVIHTSAQVSLIHHLMSYIYKAWVSRIRLCCTSLSCLLHLNMIRPFKERKVDGVGNNNHPSGDNNLVCVSLPSVNSTFFQTNTDQSPSATCQLHMNDILLNEPTVLSAVCYSNELVTSHSKTNLLETRM